MNGKQDDKASDKKAFSELFGDATPLRTGPTTPARRVRSLDVERAAGPIEPIVFERFDQGEGHAGSAPGVDRKHLRKLRSGKLEIEARIDLHGLTAREAQVEVQRFIAESWECGRRYVLIVHGRGQHSEGEAVLKAQLPTWLAQPPAGPQILAFSTAIPRDGGFGATYVLLRRHRR